MDYHLFLGEDSWGPMPKHAAVDFSENRQIFKCEMCSTAGVVVYHNIFGEHHHATKEQLKELLVYVRNVING